MEYEAIFKNQHGPGRRGGGRGSVLCARGAPTLEAENDSRMKRARPSSGAVPRLSREEALTRLAQRPHLAQAAITKAEASHRSVFVSGWRPAIGWVAAISLFFFYVPQYFSASAVWVISISESGWSTPLPQYPTDADGLLELVLALIGLGALRTVEKVNGRAK